jgi:hypothetical protein
MDFYFLKIFLRRNVEEDKILPQGSKVQVLKYFHLIKTAAQWNVAEKPDTCRECYSIAHVQADGRFNVLIHFRYTQYFLPSVFNLRSKLNCVPEWLSR